MVKPKKYLGQHFLHDKNIAKKIVGLICPANTIIEVGAGTGALSQLIYEQFNEKAFFYEIDKESMEFLKENVLIPEGQLFLQDFLSADLSSHLSPIHIVGNFPYNISSQLFFKILDHYSQIQQVICMVQKEVAQRIAAQHGSKTYGILSVFIQTFYDVKYHFQVNESAFIPPPKVKSAVIELVHKKELRLPCDENLFKKIVKTAFNQRRKILSNSLQTIVSKQLIPLEYASMRPEMLSVNDFLNLTEFFYQNNVR